MSLKRGTDGSSIADQAAGWAARLIEDRRPETRRQFDRWREADPRHAAAFDAAAAMLSDVPSLRSSPALSRRLLRSGALRRAPAGRFALAASIAFALMIAGYSYLQLNPFAPGQGGIEAVMLSTSVGEVRQFPLADGTRVTLDTASRVRVEIGRRRRKAIVEQGRARFVVAPRGVPFRLEVESAAISIDEGIVDVSALAGRREIDLLAGRARIDSEPGEGLQQRALTAPVAVERPGTPAQLVRPLAPQADEWPTGRLSFTGASLGEVVAAANRYTRAQIFIADPAIARLRVSGVFRTGDAPGLARSLGGLFGLKVEQNRAGNIVLERSGR